MIDNLAYPGEDPIKPGFNNDGSPSNNTYGDTHTLTFSTACGSSGTNWQDSTVTTCTGLGTWLSNYNTRRVTTNNITGSSASPLNDRMGNSIQNTQGNLYNNGGNTAQCTNNPTGGSNMGSICISYLYHWCTAVGLDDTTTPTCAAASHLSTNANNTSPNSTTNIAMTGVVGKPGGKGGESRGNPTGIGNQAGVNSTTSGTICPAGWRLPVGRVGDTNTATSNLNNEWNILSESMYSRTLFTDTSSTTINLGSAYASNFYSVGSFSAVGSGYFVSLGGLYLQSYGGYYWSSSLGSASSAATTYVTSSNVGPGTSNDTKYSGLAVRCVL